MKNLRVPKILMITTIVLLAAFEGYWLHKLYADEYNSLKKEVDVTFRETVYKLQNQRFEKDSTFINKAMAFDSVETRHTAHKKSARKNPEQPIVHVFSRNLTIDNLGEIPRIDSIHVGQEKAFTKMPPPGFLQMILKEKAAYGDSERVVIRMNKDELKGLEGMHGAFSKVNYVTVVSVKHKAPEGDSANKSKGGFIHLSLGDTAKMQQPSAHATRINHKLIDTTVVSSQQKSTNKIKQRESPIFRFFSSNKTINDSIPLHTVDSAYKKELSKSNKKLDFTILFKACAGKDIKSEELKKDSSKELVTSTVLVGFNTPYCYSAKFNHVNKFLVQKMEMQIGGSVFLLLMVMGSFIVLYRNLLAQQKLSAIKNEFISNITHELKTPIATVTVAIEALQNFGVISSPEKTKEYLDISASELQRLSLLVDKVLKLSMFENKEIELRKELFNFKQLTEEVIGSMKLQFEKSHAQINFITEGEQFLVEADKLHITSVVYNLLDNALKYSKENPQIDVCLTSNATHVEFSVTDKGVGIAAEYKEKIFEKFFRVPSGDRHNTKGYGLGLSYVTHIAKRHHGSITVESELGKGSTFTVSIPYKDE